MCPALWTHKEAAVLSSLSLNPLLYKASHTSFKTRIIKRSNSLIRLVIRFDSLLSMDDMWCKAELCPHSILHTNCIRYILYTYHCSELVFAVSLQEISTLYCFSLAGIDAVRTLLKHSQAVTSQHHDQLKLPCWVFFVNKVSVYICCYPEKHIVWIINV